MYALEEILLRTNHVEIRPRLLNVHTPLTSLHTNPRPPSDSNADTTSLDVPKNPHAHLLDADVEPHPDERQVRLDTDRSFVLYPVGETAPAPRARLCR